MRTLLAVTIVSALIVPGCQSSGAGPSAAERERWDREAKEASAARDKTATEIDKLCDDYWQFLMRESPTWATYLGDRRYEDKLPDIGPEARARRRKERDAFLQRARAIKAGDTAQQLNLNLLQRDLELSNASDEHKFWQLEVDAMDGPQVWLFELVNVHPVKNDAAGRASFRKRLEAFPAYMDQYLANLRSGLGEGRTASRYVHARVVEQLAALLAKKSSEWPIAEAGGDAVDKHVRPAFQKLHDFLANEYKPRTADGISSIPGGEAAYRHLIRHHTSLDLTARQLHDIGVLEMESILGEMRQIAGRPLDEFRADLVKDRSNFALSREDYIRGFQRIVAEIEPHLPRYFARRPNAQVEVKEIESFREKDAPAAYYYAPDQEGKRKGIFYANCYDVERRPRYTMRALAVHEAIPGHHLQIAFQMELRDLPRFRRHTGVTAFVEGWGLYAERLAVEMGVYPTDLDRYGMLTYQAWRAARLVVDTGIHAFGWTRERALEYFRRHLTISETEILNEIDRYIAWPGQALAYKIGQREIQAIRAKAEKLLGDRFRIADFHVELLRHGAVPLPILNDLIDRWIIEVKSKADR